MHIQVETTYLFNQSLRSECAYDRALRYNREIEHGKVRERRREDKKTGAGTDAEMQEDMQQDAFKD